MEKKKKIINVVTIKFKRLPFSSFLLVYRWNCSLSSYGLYDLKLSAKTGIILYFCIFRWKFESFKINKGFPIKFTGALLLCAYLSVSDLCATSINISKKMFLYFRSIDLNCTALNMIHWSLGSCLHSCKQRALTFLSGCSHGSQIQSTLWNFLQKWGFKANI